MKRHPLTVGGLVVSSIMFSTFCSLGQEVPKEYQAVLTELGRKGDYKDNVFKVNIPRNDLSINVAGVQTPTPFGFGGWLAMTKGDAGMDVMMGDLVLLEDEVNPVMSILLENGIEVTALHNHFFWETPRVFYMHVHGHGTAGELAKRVKPALDLIGKGSPHDPAGTKSLSTSTEQIVDGKLNTEKLKAIIGQGGELNGPVYKVIIGRDDLVINEMGAVINARMGLNTWAAFIGTDENAAVAGDVAMKEDEVQPVLQVLRKNGLDIVAIHHHMIGSRPVIIFLHYWGTGPAEKLARGFRAALDQLGPGSRGK